MLEQPHQPVMVAEVTDLIGAAGTVIDMTIGAGGHAEALLDGDVEQVVGVDRDPEALRLAAARLARFGARYRSILALHTEAPELLGDGTADGVLYDLGASSMQLDIAERGFAFRKSGSLDMRMGPGAAGPGATDRPSAADLVNQLPERELADLIFRFGEERRSRRIAAAIVRRRPIRTTDELAGIVVSAVGRRPGGPHPARRTFQALRIAVNRELEELAASLPQAVGLLVPGGRVIVISYHSLEDGIVKRTFREDPRLRILTKKPLRPSPDEAARNPRARSARLRAAERVEEAA